jgi:DNA-binding beta-propeller fold protein YncE
MANRYASGAAVALAAALTAAPAWGYHLVREVHIPGTESWDYLSLDSHTDRLFVSHGTHVEVVDAKTLQPVGTIADTPGVHGIALAADVGRGYVSAGATGSVVVFDLESLARITEIKVTGDKPDAILYEPRTHRVLTFNGRGRNVTAIDARTNRVVGSIPLDAKPEFAVANDAGEVFVNLEDRNSIAKIDPRTLTVTAVWHLEGCEEPSGLALDRAHARLFSVCSNRIMDVVDAGSGRLVAQLPIGDKVDGAGFDAARQTAFASGGDGTLTVVKEDSPEKFSVAATVATKPGARTMVVDDATHRVFLSTAQRGAPPAGAEPRARAAVIPDTFEVLVLEP